MTRSLTGTLTTLALCIVATSAHAQSASPTKPGASPSVTIMLKDAFSRPDLAAVVRREPDGTNVIALKRSAATPEVLASALAALRSSRARQPSSAKAITVIILEGIRHRPLQASERGQMATMLDQIRSAPRRATLGAANVSTIAVALTP
jgi:hypothetical protein